MYIIIFAVNNHLQRCLLFFSRQIRHIHANSNEWYRVHRSGGGGGNGWGILALIAGVMFVCWLAYKIFIWTVEIIQNVLQGICTCVIAAVPFVLLGGIVLAGVMWFLKSRHK
jgi:hypothetical protein